MRQLGHRREEIVVERRRGSSWAYEPIGGRTSWSRTNTVILRNGLLRSTHGPLVERRLRAATRTAVDSGKAAIEGSPAAN